ncbi:hypothetical protein [Hoeflea sp.]|uniref:hypothetical protein n=1 Tax=Hoeflea sp. TaxID=1940281 RepID=UPI00374A84CA
MGTVKLGGVSIELSDPCALYQGLYIVKLKLISGEMTGEYSIQSPVTREEVVFSPANLAALDAEMTRLQASCQQTTSGRRPSRRMKLRY